VKRYLENGQQYCRLTYKPEGEPWVHVWAEWGNLVDDIIQWFYEVDDYGNRLDPVYVQVGEFRTRPAKLNLKTEKLERESLMSTTKRLHTKLAPIADQVAKRRPPLDMIRDLCDEVSGGELDTFQLDLCHDMVLRRLANPEIYGLE
jgi:hypothetical protein